MKSAQKSGFIESFAVKSAQKAAWSNLLGQQKATTVAEVCIRPPEAGLAAGCNPCVRSPTGGCACCASTWDRRIQQGHARPAWNQRLVLEAQGFGPPQVRKCEVYLRQNVKVTARCSSELVGWLLHSGQAQPSIKTSTPCGYLQSLLGHPPSEPWGFALAPRTKPFFGCSCE